MSYRRQRYVKIPEGSDTPLTKAEFLAHVSRLGTDLALARYRYEHTICKDLPNRQCLDEEEHQLWQLAHESAKRLCDRHDMSAIEKLAEIAKREEAEAMAEAKREVVYSSAVDKLLEDHNAPVRKFALEQPSHEVVRLAMALLDYAGCEERVPAILRELDDARDSQRYYNNRLKTWASCAHAPPVWKCPRCEGEGHMGGTKYAKDPCKLCDGRGFVLADADSKYDQSHDYDELDLTYEGRQAINRGDAWTPEDEANAAGYESIEDAEEDGWQLPDWFNPTAEEKAA